MPLAQMDHLNVAIERNAVHSAVEEAVIDAIGVIEVIKRQTPFVRETIKLMQKTRCCKVAQPWRKELQGIETGIAGNEFGQGLVIETAVGDRNQLDGDTGQFLEWNKPVGRRLCICGTHGKTNRRTGKLAAGPFPVDGPDPVLVRVPRGTPLML